MSNAFIKNGQSVIGLGHAFRNKPSNIIRTTTEKLESDKIRIQDKGEGRSEKREKVLKFSNRELNESTSTRESIAKKILAKDQIDIIKEAGRIMRERGKTSGSSLNQKTKSKGQYLVHNKEISLKNYLIGLLKDKRTEINDKELAITQALKQSENKLERDYKDFLAFMEKEKIRLKEMEGDFIKIKNDNDSNKKHEKHLLNENKMVIADLERKVKDILGYKSLAIFLHSAVGVSFQFNKDVESEIKMIEQRDKERNIEILTNKLIDDFFKIDLEDFFPDFLNDISNLTGKFLELEEVVLKMIEQKHITEKELKLLDEIHREELEELSKREAAVNEEKIKLLKEKDSDQKTLTVLRNINMEGDSKEYLEYIHELINENHNGFNLDSGKIKKRNEKLNYMKELVDSLREKEFQVIKYITELEKMEHEDENLFRSLVINRKEKNKETKQILKIDAKNHMIAAKVKKAEERSNRIVIKGRKVINRNPIHKEYKQTKEKLNFNKENDDSMLFFYSNDI